jgi:cyclic beta-1,2-glucan synthetase
MNQPVALVAPARAHFSSLDEDAVWDDPEHLRGEILPEVLLLEHAERLGEVHLRLETERGRASPLRRRFRKVRASIQEAYQVLAEGAERRRDPSPAELWLLDNGHVVEGQLREIEEDLPWGYLVQLPRMSSGKMRGYPLVYALCLDYLRYTDFHVDFETLERFVAAYQKQRALKIGELWAIPIMLRLGLVIAVSALATSEAQATDRDQADQWARRLLGEKGPLDRARPARGEEPQEALAELKKTARKQAPSDAFLVTLLRRLREHDEAPPEALAWINEQAEKMGTSSEALTRRHHLKQAAAQVSVGSAITSMRAINTLDWSVFFDSTSLVEETLRRDPSGVYSKMDAVSRDRYRHGIERLARASKQSELRVAETALHLAILGQGTREDYRAHVGYYLKDDGQTELWRDLNYRPRLTHRVERFRSKHPSLLYLGNITLITAALSALAWAALASAEAPLWLRAILYPGMLLASSEIAVAVVNAAVVALVSPRILPKFEFEDGVPESCRTMVVVPTLLGSEAEVRSLLDELLVKSLANPDEHLSFALLTDFPDADVAETEEDSRLLELVQAGIEELNSDQTRPRFFLFHRSRIWDEQEQRYLGWERKRGKLHEFNQLLRGKNDTTFSIVTAPEGLLHDVKYVITLDTDTELPPGVARRLVATIAHPLNRPIFNAQAGRVTRGHAMLQPRVGTSPMSARRSIYARLAAGPPGIDPYTTAVSDVYQDFFGEGSFVGKGIYDVDAFSAVMAGRVPENQLLSHDLFESIYARAALVSDVEVLDEQPASYAVAAGRQHRWIRGDWQLLPWLFPRTPAEEGTRRFDFRAFDTWRVVDNLRRSLLPPSLVLFMAATWAMGFETACVSTLLLVSVFWVPVFGRLVFAFARADSQLDWLGGLGGDLKSNAKQAWLSLTFLLDQAFVSLDAIARALYRQFWSRRHLLEWVSMRDAASRAPSSVLRVPRLLGSAFLALGAIALLIATDAPAAPLALPVLSLWALAPWIAIWVSRIEPERAVEPWGEAEALAFRRIARKTWRFFERFVGELDHDLPPDNFQEQPRGVIAHRTSPTNIGLYLLSVAAARDLGFITLQSAVGRLHRTLFTLEKLEKREGHIFNWYDTRTLEPLEPRYVSTVDSGNLAGYLMTLAEICREAKNTPLVSERLFLATLDALYLAREAHREHRSRADSSSLVRQLIELIESIEARRTSGEPFVGLVFEAARESERLLSGWQREQSSPSARSWIEAARAGLREALETWTEFSPHLVWLEAAGFFSNKRPQEWSGVQELLDQARRPARFLEVSDELKEHITALAPNLATKPSLKELTSALSQAQRKTEELLQELDSIAARSDELVGAMDFSFLYDEERSLFSIGYNVSSARLDNSHYDLLASEARLASLVAIAKGEVPVKHWFRLGRLRAKFASAPGLLSWSGSMFEYLMPLLVTRSYPDTLLDQTYRAVIERQIEYAREFGVPFGISEAAYNVMDLGMNYQYRAFGVPGLGLKPGLGEDLVIAPYATALSALVRAQAAARNFEALAAAGLEGEYGFYESADYTKARVPPTRKMVVVKAYMAHHQGMTLVALSNLLTDFSMQRRFHADARIKACALLLEERIPVRAGVVEPETTRTASPLAQTFEQEVTEHLDLAQARTSPPRGHLLGQGDLSSWISAGGEGFLTWRGIDVQRFREEASLSCGGILLYFQTPKRKPWSSGYMPTRSEPSHYDAIFSVDKVELSRRDGPVETLTEITLSPEHPAEIRRVTLTSHASSPLQVRITSFTELSLTPRSADVAHPAFQKMFLELESLPNRPVLIAHRKRRSNHDPHVWMAQMLVGLDPKIEVHLGTSRAAFLGRNGDICAPRGLSDDSWRDQPGTLDPASILQADIELDAGGQVRFSLITLLAETKEALLADVEHFFDTHSVARAFEFAWADARVDLRHLGITSSKAHRYQRLLSAVLFPQAGLRENNSPPISVRGRDALWSQGISGDLPIVLLRLDAPEFTDLCRDLLLAHEYWRLHGMATDLVILNEEAASYLQPVQDAVLNLIRSTPAEGHVDQRGGVFVRRSALINEEDLKLLATAARVVLSASKGSLAQQLRSLTLHSQNEAGRPHPIRAPLSLPRSSAQDERGGQTFRAHERHGQSERDQLLFENSIGGFDQETGAYRMRIGKGQRPPQPWSNVIAGPNFGTLVTESGSSFTWYQNSQKNRLTPWSNDPTLDPSGELFFLRDLESGAFHSLTPSPAGGDAIYDVVHEPGVTTFRHTREGLSEELSVGVDPNDPIKVWRVRLANHSSRVRRLRVYAYAEWVLGPNREQLRVSTITYLRPDLRALLARNPLSPFPKSWAFLASTEEVRSMTADRGEFFGPFGSRAAPLGLFGSRLSGRSGAGLDPAAALELELTLAPGDEREFAFALGAGDDERQAHELIARYNQRSEASAVIERSRDQFRSLFGRMKVRSPDPSFDVMVNHWLPYQVLSCRFWGRSAFFQSGGAYGFRDQLQDSMALLQLRPDLAKKHILLAASRQFLEGDVQHWWHPDTGEGVRTHCSDDLVWLPWAAVEYVTTTGDHLVLDEPVGFLQERRLDPGQDDLYSVPPAAAESAPLYEHCVRALEAAVTRGPRGLPLMRAGDWNDGMNRVGEGFRGESVWLGWFLAHTLARFAQVAEERGDRARAHFCWSEAERIARAIDESAWDGQWYQRASFDDGTPIGSHERSECRIDAIAQSWAVIAGVGRADRARRALDSSLEHLWLREEKMMLLLTPPFTSGEPDPGYIATYPPGVRENGGQYSHGVLWTVLALLLERRSEEAYRLFQDLNPISHTSTSAEVEKYQVEPYVLAADVYAEPRHLGRGGWTWYTGSASWMYRIAVEWILGLRRRGDEIFLDPCLPPSWPQLEVDYTTESGGTLQIRLDNPRGSTHGVARLWVNDEPALSSSIALPKAGERTRVRLELGPLRDA